MQTTTTVKMNLSPFVKWAGGKTQLLESITALTPQRFETYHEPFAGGAAVLLELQPTRATVNDMNAELMTAYRLIRDDLPALVKKLKEMVKKHNETAEAKDYYYAIRAQQPDGLTEVEQAARFIYLNKLGFNGLYRVNAKGEFNVPFNKKENIKNATVFSEANLKRLSTYLKDNDIALHCEDFGYILNEAQAGDFVFIDSPYDESWNGYQAGGFGEAEHRRLADTVKELHRNGVKFMLTNHNTPLIQELYAEFRQFEVPVNRAINSKGADRANATTELIIVNYDVTSEQLREFNISKFYKQLKPTSFVLKEYVQWEKLQKRVVESELALNDLNLLFASNEQEFESKFDRLYAARPESFAILPLLLSVRNRKFVYLDEHGEATQFTHEDRAVVFEFLHDSGLMENLFLNGKYKSVTDYLLGLEVGLSSNDKKNLSGKWLVEQVERILTENNIQYEKEVPYNRVLNLGLERDKVFDFVFEHNSKRYCMEVNFFNTSGSKINSESARFVELNRTFYNYRDLDFVWLTDGNGLKANKSQITQALRQIDNMFNLTTFEEFIQSLGN